jgi:hypothetical protein
MHAFFELFAFGEIGYFSVSGIIVLILLFLDCERKTVSFWSTVLFGTLIWLSYKAFTTINARELVSISILYIFIGICYSVYKWFIRVKNIIKKHSELLKKSNINSLKELHSRPYDENYHVFGEIKEDINPNRNKHLFYNWIILWPWSITWNFTHGFFEFIFDTVKDQYNKIVDSLLLRNSKN